MTTTLQAEVTVDVGEPPPLPQAAATPIPPANFTATAVPLLLQLGLSGAIKILGPAAESSARYVVASKMYALAVFLTFTMDMVLAICFVAMAYCSGGGGGGFRKKAAAGLAMKALMAVALALSFATVILATVINILA